MKKIIALTAVAASLATGASAMVNSSVNLAEIERYAPNTDVSTLTDTEIRVLLNYIHSGDKDGEKRAFVRSFFLDRG